jgi:hypothetical protein
LRPRPTRRGGRFTFGAVVDHDDSQFDLGLTARRTPDLVQYLASL